MATIEEIAERNALGNVLSELEYQNEALRQRVKALTNAIGELALECGRDKMEHYQRSVAAEVDKNWQTAHAESKHAMALGWCEMQLHKILEAALIDETR